MTFRIAKTPRFKTKVKFKTPNASGGHDQCSITAEFERITLSEMRALRDAEENDLPLLRRVLVGWEDVSDEDGNPMPFSEAARDALIDDPIILLALSRAYAEEALTGRAAAKN